MQTGAGPSARPGRTVRIWAGIGCGLGILVLGILVLGSIGILASGPAGLAAPAPTVAGPQGTVAPKVATPVTTHPGQGAAYAQLQTLPVKGRAALTGYSRAQFGPAWADVDGNGCDTRNDILGRDLRATTSSNGCVILAGVLTDPYTGRVIAFRRGPGTSTLVQIDHVVALGDAWQKGAQQLSPAAREAFANDPLNLLAVSGSANESKGDGDAATWLPPNKAVRCSYVARQISVKAKYGLWVTAAEKAAMARVLSACPQQPAASAAGLRIPAGPPTATPAGGPVYYPNCTAARAAGVAPLHRGDPGYRSGLDRDGDGVACE